MIYKDLETCPLEDYPAIVQEALTMLRDPVLTGLQRDIAIDMIEVASLQALPAMHPHLDELFLLNLPIDQARPHYPWRESGLLHFDYLKNIILDDSRPRDLRKSAWIKMMETRQFDALHFAENVARDLDFSFDIYLEWFGYQKQGDQYRPLYPEEPLYLKFSESYLGKIDTQHREHPTWHLPTAMETPMRFGGMCDSACAVCGHKLHHVITLNPIPKTLQISGLSSLTLALCVSCLGWNWDIYRYLFYQHDADGQPRSIGYEGKRIQPEFPVHPLQETTVHLADGGARWRWQDWSSDGNLNRLGGFPAWVQDSEYLPCIRCQRPMHFLLQLNAGLPTEDNHLWIWGVYGMGYGMWCDDCHISAYLLQHT